jgi:hypothetical protein
MLEGDKATDMYNEYFVHQGLDKYFSLQGGLALLSFKCKHLTDRWDSLVDSLDERFDLYFEQQGLADALDKMRDYHNLWYQHVFLPAERERRKH